MKPLEDGCDEKSVSGKKCGKGTEKRLVQEEVGEPFPVPAHQHGNAMEKRQSMPENVSREVTHHRSDRALCAPVMNSGSRREWSSHVAQGWLGQG